MRILFVLLHALHGDLCSFPARRSSGLWGESRLRILLGFLYIHYGVVGTCGGGV